MVTQINVRLLRPTLIRAIKLRAERQDKHVSMERIIADVLAKEFEKEEKIIQEMDERMAACGNG